MLFAYVFMILGMLLTNVTEMSQFMKTPAYFWAFGACLFVVDIVMVSLVYIILNKNSLHSVSFYLKVPRSRDIALSTLAFIPLAFLINGVGEFMNTPKFIENVYAGMTSNWLCVLCVIIVNPIAEEFCFRGGVLASLHSSPKYRRYALVISSFGFGLLNLTPDQILVGFMFGMFLGWVFLRTQSLLVPIICRIFDNIIAFVTTLIFGPETKMIEMFPSHMVYYISLAISIVMAFLFFCLMKKYLYQSKIEEEI